MLRIAICDDDPHMLSSLAALCKKILPEAEVTEYKSGVELLSGNGGFEIILMDVRMEEMDGLDVIKRLQSRDWEKSPVRPSVIFITAYDDYVFEALDLFPFHYLLKPLDEEKFAKVLKLAAEKYTKREKEEAILFHTKIIICAFIPVIFISWRATCEKSLSIWKMSILKFITRWRSWKSSWEALFSAVIGDTW